MSRFKEVRRNFNGRVISLTIFWILDFIKKEACRVNTPLALFTRSAKNLKCRWYFSFVKQNF